MITMVARNRLKRNGAGSTDKSRLKRYWSDIELDVGSGTPAKVISMEDARKFGKNEYPATVIVPALEYAAKNKNSFAGNHFDNIAQFKKFVTSLEAGGTKAFVGEIYAEPWRMKEEGDIYAATLFVVDPTEGGFAEIVREHPDEFSKKDLAQNVWRVWWD